MFEYHYHNKGKYVSNNLIANNNFDVLIVEDEPVLAMAMEVKLKKLGLCVSGIASTPDNAILHAQNHYPDIAIVEYKFK